MAVKENQTKQVMQLSARVSELKHEAVIKKESVTDLNVLFKVSEKCAEDVAYGRNCLQARLQQSQRGQDKVG